MALALRLCLSHRIAASDWSRYHRQEGHSDLLRVRLSPGAVATWCHSMSMSQMNFCFHLISFGVFRLSNNFQTLYSG